ADQIILSHSCMSSVIDKVFKCSSHDRTIIPKLIQYHFFGYRSNDWFIGEQLEKMKAGSSNEQQIQCLLLKSVEQIYPDWFPQSERMPSSRRSIAMFHPAYPQMVNSDEFDEEE